MAGPVSIRLDEHLRRDLEEEATARGVPLASLIRDILATAVRDARRQRIRESSARVAAYIATSAPARAMLTETGGPHSDQA
ncbi:BrnA antitoxin family protein [Acetobacter garciniae]|nr:BrnA antitoxin family protein [Acetobacter garciniae]